LDCGCATKMGIFRAGNGGEMELLDELTLCVILQKPSVQN
jgi:hypothetical protein